MSDICGGNGMQVPVDIMLTWFASHVNPIDVMSGMCNTCAHMANIPT